MSTALTPGPTAAPAARPDASARLGLGAALRTVVGMELRQRLRSRGWYVLLAVFFVLVGLVTLGGLGLHAMTTADGAFVTEQSGTVLFDLVLLFVLTLSLLVSPALSANAISGDRAGGTLAITQVTLLTTGQLMLGKWAAAWIASAAFLAAASPWLVLVAVIGGAAPGSVLVGLLMILVEFAVITGIGVAVSAIAGRTLFAVVVTYLLVALLTIGSVVGTVLGMQFITVDVRTNQMAGHYDEATDTFTSTCEGPLEAEKVPDPRRLAWLVVPNPYVVTADAVPFPRTSEGDLDTERMGALNAMSAATRMLQMPPEALVDCVDGRPRAEGEDPFVSAPTDTLPMWPLGLALQGVLTGGLLWWGHRRLDTPAGRLPTGTRVA